MPEAYQKIKLCGNNFAEASNTTSTSFLSPYVEANMFTPSRFEVARFYGNFTVTSSNNKIYINDGSDKTATLTAGTYNYVAMAAHIQTQLNAVSSSWTCTYDATTTFRFTIARSSGTAILRITQTTDAAWDLLGYVDNADKSGSPFPADEQRNHSEEYIQVDLGGSANGPTFMAAFGPNDVAATVSQNATVLIKANNLDTVSGWASPPYSKACEINRLGIMANLNDVDTDYRYWRLSIIDRYGIQGPTGIQIGSFYLGDHIELTYNMSRGFQRGTVDPSVRQVAEGGALYFNQKLKYDTFSSVSLGFLPNAERELIEQFFFDKGTHTPWIISLDPAKNCHESLEHTTRYVVFSEPPRLSHIRTNLYQAAFNVREYI